MNLKAPALAALCLWMAEQNAVCVHPSAGTTCRVSLESVRRAQESIRERFARLQSETERLSADGPFDSGLPGCRTRKTRSERIEVPDELVGKTLAFAKADRMPKADIRVATSCRRLSEVDAEALADAALAERLGVRCEPTVIHVKSKVDLELVEGP